MNINTIMHFGTFLIYKVFFVVEILSEEGKRDTFETFSL